MAILTPTTTTTTTAADDDDNNDDNNNDINDDNDNDDNNKEIMIIMIIIDIINDNNSRRPRSAASGPTRSGRRTAGTSPKQGAAQRTALPVFINKQAPNVSFPLFMPMYPLIIPTYPEYWGPSICFGAEDFQRQRRDQHAAERHGPPGGGAIKRACWHIQAVVGVPS